MKHIRLFENFEDDDENYEDYVDIDEYENDHDIDVIVDSYITALIWTEEGHDTGDDPWEGKDISDINEEAREKIEEEVEWFINSAGDVFEELDDEQIGHDLWLTRNGHGAGFPDRIEDSENLKIIEKLCEILGSVDAYINDEWQISFDSSDKYKTFDIEEYKKKIKFDKTVKKFNV